MTGEGISCAGCGDGWTVHESPDEHGPGPCTIPGCPCNGFRWLPVDDATRADALRRGRRGGRALPPGRVRAPA